MKYKGAKFKRALVSFLSAAGLIAVLSISLFAQRPIYNVGRRVEQINRQGAEIERDALNRDLRRDPRSANNSKQSQALKAQILKDLEGIQSEYNKIVTNLKPGGEIGPDFLIETVTSTKQIAARLLSNLALPEIKEEKQITAQSEEDISNHREALLLLCKHIYNFVTNPIFDTQIGLDIDQSTRARKDLEKIIQVSEKIKARAEKTKN